MGHHGADDSLTTVGTDRLVESDPSHGPVVRATKRLQPKIGLQLSKVLPASRQALTRIVLEVVGIDSELIGDKRRHVRGWGFLRAKHPPRKSQVGEMHCKAKAIRIPASLPYQAHILN